MRMIASFCLVGGRLSCVASLLSSSLPLWRVVFVDRNLLLVLCPWSFNVSSDSGKFLFVDLASRRGSVV